jgi:hypothetical protein
MMTRSAFQRAPGQRRPYAQQFPKHTLPNGIPIGSVRRECVTCGRSFWFIRNAAEVLDLPCGACGVVTAWRRVA